jgi:long-subunit acyl-CoA synthetase (AMP-forming)
MEQLTRNKGRWFKLAEAAQQLGVSEITVRRKAKSGQLKTILRNGRYMVFLEEDEELGMFSAALDSPVAPVTPTLHTVRSNNPQIRRTEGQGGEKKQEELIQSLKRTVEDQQTLIASLEASISRLTQKLSGERSSSR